MVVKSFLVSNKDEFINNVIKELCFYNISYVLIEDEIKSELHFDNFIYRFYDKKQMFKLNKIEIIVEDIKMYPFKEVLDNINDICLNRFLNSGNEECFIEEIDEERFYSKNKPFQKFIRDDKNQVNTLSLKKTLTPKSSYVRKSKFKKPNHR